MNLNIYKNIFFREKETQYNQPTFKEFKPSLLSIALQLSERTQIFINNIKNKNFDNLIDWTYNINSPTKSPICSKMMNAMYQTFRCYDCMQSASSCICAECFEKGDHKGHNYINYNSISGCCDCGNQQAWNQKGFCCDHSKQKIQKGNISSQIQSKFLAQFKLAFEIYFYLMSCKEKSHTKQNYGPALFSYIKKLADQNYEMKYLTYLLLNSEPFNFLNYPHLKGLTIIQIMFRTKPQEQGLQEFISVLFELFPVEEFRKIVLRQYFIKEKTCQKFNEHPIGGIHFQFLSCTKLIIKLINENKLEPLQIFPFKSNLHQQILPSAFKKLYEDLDYICQMKSGKDYHLIHLTKSNICNLAYYKQITSQQTFQMTHLLSSYNMDQFFLKTLKLFIRNVKSDKNILKKCLRELFDQIIKTGFNVISLAYERAFAMITLAYFDGDIKALAIQEEKIKLLDIIDPDRQLNQMICCTIVKNSLNTKIHLQKTKKQMNYVQQQQNEFESYYKQKYNQKNIPQFLDLIFHKILNLIFKSSVYPSVINAYLGQYVNFLNIYSNHKQQEKNHEVKQQKLYILLHFLNSLSRIDIDQIVISLLLEIDKKQQMIEFLSRLLSSYNQINVKQFKTFALQIINDQELIQKFIIQYATTTKGKICIKIEKEPLQTYSYNQIIDNYLKKVPFSDAFFMKKDKIIYEYQNLKLFDQQSIKILIQICMNTLFIISQRQDKRYPYYSLVCMQFLRIYIKQGTDRQNVLFKSLLGESMRQLLSKDLIQQITIIQNSQMIDFQKNRIKLQSQAENKKKKERLLNKKKQKDDLLKKNQSKILTNYENIQMKQQKQSENGKFCIYCKQNKEQFLYYFGYVGLTNLIQMSILKDKQDYHMYLQTCGHMIHLNCINLNHHKQNYCFLCKSQSNILVPIFSIKSQIKAQILGQLSQNFIVKLASVIVGERSQMKFVSKQSEEDIFMRNYNSNILNTFIKGIAKDIVYVGSQDMNRYKKEFYSIHRESLLILKSYDKDKLGKEFNQLIIECRTTEKSHQLKVLQEQILTKLSNILQQNCNSDVFRQVTDKIIQSVNGKSFFDVNDIMIEVPRQLHQLNQYMGQCKLCNHVTNYIYICLKCKWSCCRKCLNQMTVHSTFFHLDGTIFMGCTNGCLKYFQGEGLFESFSLYENYLGEPFDEVVNYSEHLRLQKFFINNEKLSAIKQIMINYKIHHKIFINQN